jgi:myo-inositol-1-phosphate synthase
LLVGLGGNNGSTLVAGILANKKKISWESKNGIQTANFYGSFTQSSTVHVGFKHDSTTGVLNDVYKPVKDLIPLVDPCEFEISGWDISKMNLYDACKRSRVLEPDLIKQLKPEL